MLVTIHDEVRVVPMLRGLAEVGLVLGNSGGRFVIRPDYALAKSLLETTLGKVRIPEPAGKSGATIAPINLAAAPDAWLAARVYADPNSTALERELAHRLEHAHAVLDVYASARTTAPATNPETSANVA